MIVEILLSTEVINISTGLITIITRIYNINKKTGRTPAKSYLEEKNEVQNVSAGIKQSADFCLQSCHGQEYHADTQRYSPRRGRERSTYDDSIRHGPQHRKKDRRIRIGTGSRRSACKAVHRYCKETSLRGCGNYPRRAQQCSDPDVAQRISDHRHAG